ncbi:hypothetical protein ACS0TY_005230 [Phlomoides rotata]
MQSRLATAATRFNRMLFPGAGKQFPVPERLYCATSTGRTADPAEHQDVYPCDAIHDEKLRHKSENEPTSKIDESYIPPKSPNQSAPKIGSTGVWPRPDPMAQQKRRQSVVAGKLDDVICSGIDGSPLPDQEVRETDRRTQREEEERDDKEYFKHHKASPLSEIEIAETRKPVTIATDGIAEKETVGNEGGVWRAEQLETVEETMQKAMELFRWNAMRGDPDSPHGKVLRQLRGEYW